MSFYFPLKSCVRISATLLVKVEVFFVDVFIVGLGSERIVTSSHAASAWGLGSHESLIHSATSYRVREDLLSLCKSFFG